VEQLYDASLSHNRDAEITGLLLYDGIRFMQSIEGGVSVIDALMRRISNDNRHDSLEVMADQTIVTREFQRWGMDRRLIDANDNGSAFVANVKADMREVQDPQVRAAFIGFASLMARRRG
jgi:hypothetical protein